MNHIVIWKSHHSFCDGMSVMFMLLAMSHEYDRSYFVKGKDATLLERILIRLMAPLQLPTIFWNMLGNRASPNFITKNKNKLTGELNVASSEELHF